MAEDRPANDEVSELAALRAEFNDFKATMAARASRLPTGAIVAWPGTTELPDTLFCNGQTLARADYPVLVDYATTQGIIGVGKLFGAGDGSTTFAVPDLRGVNIIGVGTLGADTFTLGQRVGAATVTLTAAQVPNHGHTATAADNTAANTGNAGTHDHTGTNSSSHEHLDDANHSHTISGDGGHAGHNSGSVGTSAGAGSGYSIANSTQNTLGSHSHGGGTGGAGVHSHGVSGGHVHSIDPDANHAHSTPVHAHTLSVAATTGGGSPHENRPPSVALNHLIWI